jgi:hypothetical protein
LLTTEVPSLTVRVQPSTVEVLLPAAYYRGVAVDRQGVVIEVPLLTTWVRPSLIKA